MKTRKIKMMIGLIVIIWVVLSIVGIYRFVEPPGAYETTKKIWMPEKYNIVNQIDGNYTPIRNVHLSGTAVYIPFQSFKEIFVNKNIDVIIQTDGLVYYIVKEAERKFFTKLYYVPYKSRRSHRWKIIISDLTVKNFYGFDYDIIFKSMVIFLLCGVAIVGFGWICHQVIEKIKSMRTKAT